MDKITADIKAGNISNIYLFYGEEAFKRKNYKELLKNVVVNGNTINYSYYEGKNIDFKAVYDSCVTLPFFAERRLVVVENCEKFKIKGKDSKAQEDDKADGMLEKILAELPKSTCLAFFEESAAKNKKLYKTIAKEGVVVPCEKDSEETVINWLAQGFKKSGKKIRRSTLQLLVDRVGTDYVTLRSEFEKIIGYVGDREVVEDDDILQVSSDNIESKIFDMLGAMSEKNTKLVLDKYYDLLANKEHPLMIMAMIRSQFRTMLETAELSNKGLSTYEAAKTLGKQSFVIERSKKYLRNFRMRDIENILDEICIIDRKCKSGDIEDKIGVETMLVKFSS